MTCTGCRGPEAPIRRPSGESALHCDELVSLPKSRLTAYVGRLSGAKLTALDRALVVALDIDVSGRPH